jgi:hypothetical protein
VANYRVSTNTNSNSNKTTKNIISKKKIKLKLYIFKSEFSEISVDLQAIFAAETHLAEEQWLKDLLNFVKLLVQVF